MSNPSSYHGQINDGSITDQFFGTLFHSSDLYFPDFAMDEPASNASIQFPDIAAYFATCMDEPASNASIQSLKIIKSIEDGKSEEEEECSICFEKLFDKENKDTVVKEMPCGHRFHGKCIDKWLEAHRSCPLCRYKMELSNKFWDNRRALEQYFESSFYRSSFDST